MSDNAAATPTDPAEAMRAEATARLAAIDAKKGAAPKAAPASEKPAAVEAPKETADKASLPGGDSTPAVATEAVDVEWLPDNLRSKATTLDPELAKFLKANVMRRTEASRLHKAIEKEREEIKAIKEKADLWARLQANPEVADAAYRMLNGEAPAAAAPEKDDEVPDPVLDPKGYAKWLRESIVKDIRGEASKVVDERVFQPKSIEAEIKSACDAWAEDNHLTDPVTLNRVAVEADVIAKEMGVVFTPENTPKILSRAYKSLGYVGGSNGKNGTENGGLLKVASPTNRGSTAVSPQGVPEHIRQGVAPRTDEERVAHAAYLARTRLGMRTTTEDIRTLFSGRGIPSA